jgi:site-specific recombinase XerD
LSLRTLRHLIKGHYLAAGVLDKDKTAHSLRHAAISTALQRGTPVQKVAAMARHASIETTMICLHAIDRLSDQAERYISYNGTDGEKGNA